MRIKRFVFKKVLFSIFPLQANTPLADHQESSIAEGFSSIEVILAAAVFVILTAGITGVVIQGININRLSAEHIAAVQFAAEGLEAVRSIRNQSYGTLAGVNAAPRGLILTGQTWSFDGDDTSDILVHNVSDNYTRTIKVEPVNRDAAPPGGNIVSTAGNPDNDTKKIISTVNWNFNLARPERVNLVSYLTDWKKPFSNGGVLVYGRAGNNIPRINLYTDSDNTFSVNGDTILGGAGSNFVIKTSPKRKEAVAAYMNSGNLRVICFDGVNWTNEWEVNSGGNGTTRRFDLAYEKKSGDVLVLFSRDTGSNELGYKTKPGHLGCGSANWSAQTNFDSAATSGVVTWVKLAADQRGDADVLAAAWADMNRDLQAAVWDGNNWIQRGSTLESNLECRGSCTSPNIPNIDAFDIDIESLSGEIMVVWGSGGSGTANGAWYNKCDGGNPPSCSWMGTRAAISGLANDATSLDLSVHPASDEMIFASIGDDGSDLQAAYWSGSSWTGANDLDTSAISLASGSSLVATGWLVNESLSLGIVVFANGGTDRRQTIHGFVWDGNSFSRQGSESVPWFTPNPLFDLPRWYDIQLDPQNRNKLMLLVANSVNDLFAKRLEMGNLGSFSWTDPVYRDGSLLENNLVQSIASPYYFSYWQNK